MVASQHEEHIVTQFQLLLAEKANCESDSFRRGRTRCRSRLFEWVVVPDGRRIRSHKRQQNAESFVPSPSMQQMAPMVQENRAQPATTPTSNRNHTFPRQRYPFVVVNQGILASRNASSLSASILSINTSATRPFWRALVFDRPGIHHP